MYLFGNRDIQVKEYTQNSVVTKSAPIVSTGFHTPFRFNGWRLAHGVARTICARTILNPEYWLDYISGLLGLAGLIHSSNLNSNVRISSDRIKHLRDFSRTSRIGELSQGLMYLYMQETGFPYLNDFHFFCTQENIFVPSKTSTPDFVCQDIRQSNHICLAESKGKELTSSGEVKSKLAKAISQCVSGETIINSSLKKFKVKKQLGFCAEWSDENKSSDSVFHFVDPEKEILRPVENSAPMRYHYAAWFYMIGDFYNAERLINDMGIKWNEKNYQQVGRDGKKYWTLKRFPSSFSNDAQNIFTNKDLLHAFVLPVYFNANIGISVDVINALKKQEYERLTQLDFDAKSTDHFEFFADGTIIYKNF